MDGRVLISLLDNFQRLFSSNMFTRSTADIVLSRPTNIDANFGRNPAFSLPMFPFARAVEQGQSILSFDYFSYILTR